jgi:hypothetical protein
MPEAATALSSEAGFFGKRVESRSSKKRDRLGKLRAWWRDYQDSRRDSSQDEDALIGRALHQHKLHFSEVYGLRRDQSGRIFLKNDRLVFHEGE